MSSAENYLKLQKRMEKAIDVYNNPAVKHSLKIAAIADRAYHHSLAFEKVLGTSTIQMLDNPLVWQIQRHHQLLERCTSIHPALSMPISEVSQRMLSVAAGSPFYRISINSHVWDALHYQLNRIIQLPEWSNLRDNLEPEANIDELLTTINASPSQRIEPKLTPKRRKRMIVKAQAHSYSLSVADYCSITSLLITLYQVLVDESIKSQISIILNKLFIAVSH